jgi:hypothetical protein
VYVARVEAPKGVTVTVKPAMLAFADGVTKRSFMVTVTADTRNLVMDDSGAMFGSLSWSDGTHVVRTEVEKVAPPRAKGDWSRDTEILREETVARE